jgi:hypothetical protein
MYTKEQKNVLHVGAKDLIRDKVTEDEKEAMTTRKPGTSSADGKVPKSGLVIKHWKRVFIIDITVCHENGNYLGRGDWVSSKNSPRYSQISSRHWEPLFGKSCQLW